jgi:hypothetical protein
MARRAPLQRGAHLNEAQALAVHRFRAQTA